MSAALDYLALLRAENEKNIPRPRTAQTDQTGLGSLCSSPPRHFQSKNVSLKRWRVIVNQGVEQRRLTLLTPAKHDLDQAHAAARFHFGARLVEVNEEPTRQGGQR